MVFINYFFFLTTKEADKKTRFLLLKSRCLKPVLYLLNYSFKNCGKTFYLYMQFMLENLNFANRIVGL